uniref:SANTA domain-containing protein n=1 Tax=Heterorhabditis bacteriophora TaxID=37862 RepID=A0A1I7XCM0_HETBA
MDRFETEGDVLSRDQLIEKIGPFIDPPELKHRNYVEMSEYLKLLTLQFPNLTYLYSAGESVRGRQLWVLTVSRFPKEHTHGVPEFKYIANMHGNEVSILLTGYRTLGRNKWLSLLDMKKHEKAMIRVLEDEKMLTGKTSTETFPAVSSQHLFQISKFLSIKRITSRNPRCHELDAFYPFRTLSKPPRRDYSCLKRPTIVLMIVTGKYENSQKLEQIEFNLSAIHGTIIDSSTGDGIINATISIDYRSKIVISYENGEFWRLINLGTYEKQQIMEDIENSVAHTTLYIDSVSSMIMELTLDRRKSLGSKDRICIRLWVFKFVINNDGDFGVCVEGYRPNDATETILRNWHSTIIKERLTSTLLITRSGSTYELRGNMDETLATQYGYPSSLTDMFKCGFPPDWESVLREYYDSIRSVYTYNMNSRLWGAPNKMFSECDSTTVRSVTRKKDKTLEVGKCRGKGISLENNDSTDAYVDVSFGSENKSKSNSNDCVTGKEMLAKYITMYVLVDKEITGLHSRGQIISLREWSIRFVPIEPRIPKLAYPAFVILGRRESSVAQWQTSVIMDVVNGRFCSTISTTYYLEGDMQIMDAAEVGKCISDVSFYLKTSYIYIYIYI